MIYCRWGKDSEAYAYEEGAPNRRRRWVINTRSDSYSVNKLSDFKSLMTTLRDRGVKIPKMAFDKIEEELKKEEVERKFKRGQQLSDQRK